MIAVDQDGLIWGCRNIAIAANLLDENGEPRERAAFHLLAKGYLPANKVGGRWVTTLRKLRSIIDE